jgi:hypothetical protein
MGTEWNTGVTVCICSTIERAMIKLYIGREWYTEVAVCIPSTI